MIKSTYFCYWIQQSTRTKVILKKTTTSLKVLVLADMGEFIVNNWVLRMQYQMWHKLKKTIKKCILSFYGLESGWIHLQKCIKSIFIKIENRICTWNGFFGPDVCKYVLCVWFWTHKKKFFGCGFAAQCIYT